MKLSIKGLLLALLALGGAMSLSGQVVLEYDFDDNTTTTTALSPSTSVANLTGSVMTLSSGTISTGSTTGSPTGLAIFEGGGWGDSTPTKYFTITLTIAPGFTLDITDISFDYRRTNSGPTSANISIEGVTSETIAIAVASNYTDLANSVTATGLTGTHEIRIYGFDPTDTVTGGGTFGLDELQISGTVSAVPEPSSFAALVGLGVLGFAGMRRRQQRVA